MVSLADRITEELDAAPKRTFEPGKVAASAVGAPFWLVGWLTFWVLAAIGGVMRTLGAAVSWCALGVKLGWLDARDQATRRDFATGRWPTRPRKPRAAGGTG